MLLRTKTAPLIAVSSLVLSSLLGAGAAHAAPAPRNTDVPAPRLVHTGNAYPDHATGAARISPDTRAPSAFQIVPTFASSINRNPDAAVIKKGIKADIKKLEGLISTPVTVHIAFESVSTGLGGSSTYYNSETYAAFRSDLANQANPSAYDTQARQSLPATAKNPVNGSKYVNLTLPLLRATGEAALGDSGTHVDSTILLNTSLMNFSRTGPQDPDKYDLQQVAMHEMVETIGAGGAGSGLAAAPQVVGSLDLFRYSANGVRSYTTDPTATAYFSTDGGLTNRSYFNQQGGGTDFGDWDSNLNGFPQVQDAFSTPGVQVNLDGNEKIALDIVGYQVKGV